MKKDYEDGEHMDVFERIPSISKYNRNYYLGKNGDILYGLSDDDNTTEWFIVHPIYDSVYLGESYCSDDEKLTKYNGRRT